MPLPPAALCKISTVTVLKAGEGVGSTAPTLFRKAIRATGFAKP